MDRSSRRRVVGGTGEGAGAAGAVVLGMRVRTAARKGSPTGTSVPHVAHTLPPWFTPSQTRQRQIALISSSGP
jgi:hypothetical protein